jgi:hypothetical protein
MKKTILALSVAALAAVAGTTSASAFSAPLATTDGASSAVTPVGWYGKHHYGYGYKPYYYGRHYGYGYGYRHYGWRKHYYGGYGYRHHGWNGYRRHW